MNNVMIINGHKAVICYDLEIEMFRGEFVGLNGGADFYAGDVGGLHREGDLLRCGSGEGFRRERLVH